MAILGHGIDLVECTRIARIMENHKARFLDRVLTAAEQQHTARYTRGFVQSVAGRWAAKEAILKVIGTGWRGKIAWTDMEILPDALGKPTVTLTGETARLAAARGMKRIVVSITHTAQHAAASAIGLSDD